MTAQLRQDNPMVDMTSNKAESELRELVGKLVQAAGVGLESAILYGSAASGEFQPGYSNLNVLCLVDNLNASALDRLAPVSKWWARKGQPAPLLFTREELRRASNVFTIELLDMKANHRVLHGADFLASLDVPMEFRDLQVERELRHALVGLRQRYLLGSHKPKDLLRLMTSSVSSFAALFRHALSALDGRSGSGQPAPRVPGKREAIDQLAARLEFDPEPFRVALDLRERTKKAGAVDAAAAFQAYLASATRAVEELDARLETQGGTTE